MRRKGKKYFLNNKINFTPYLIFLTSYPFLATSVALNLLNNPETHNPAIICHTPHNAAISNIPAFASMNPKITTNANPVFCMLVSIVIAAISGYFNFNTKKVNRNDIMNIVIL